MNVSISSPSRDSNLSVSSRSRHHTSHLQPWMTLIKCRKRQKFVYCIFAFKILCHYYVIIFRHSVIWKLSTNDGKGDDKRPTPNEALLPRLWCGPLSEVPPSFVFGAPSKVSQFWCPRLRCPVFVYDAPSEAPPFEVPRFPRFRCPVFYLWHPRRGAAFRCPRPRCLRLRCPCLRCSRLSFSVPSFRCSV